MRFFRFQLEIPFLGKFGKKNQNCQLKLKFGTCTNSNVQNSVVMFTFSVFNWNYPFWANLVQKIKIVSLSWNLVPKLIRKYRIQWHCSFFFVLVRKHPFWANLVQKIKLVSLSWNLVPRLIRICRTQWCCSRFLFNIVNNLFLVNEIKRSAIIVTATLQE